MYFYKVCLYLLQLRFSLFFICSERFLAGWYEVGDNPPADMDSLRDEVDEAERVVSDAKEALRKLDEEDWDPPRAQLQALEDALETALRKALETHEQYAEGVLRGARRDAGLAAMKSAIAAGLHLLSFQSRAFELSSDLAAL